MRELLSTLNIAVVICRAFTNALHHGTKYIYQALPRLLTIYLEFGDDTELIKYIKSRKKKYVQ